MRPPRFLSAASTSAPKCEPLLLGAFGFKMSHDVDSSLNVSINQTSRTITLWDNLHPIISSSVVHEPVPSDYNIFALLRVAPPKGHEDNDDFLRNWTVVIGQDSPWRDELNRTYEVITFYPNNISSSYCEAFILTFHAKYFFCFIC